MSNLTQTPNAFIDLSPVELPATHRFFELSLALGQKLKPMPEQQLEQNSPPALSAQSDLPDACVLLLLTDEVCPKVLLTRRATHLSSHAGEVSLVGGKRDDTDSSSWAVALREAYEEVALPKSKTSLLGYLPMQHSKKGLLVRPVVASVVPSVADELVANADEIHSVFWVDLNKFYTKPTEYQFTHTWQNQSHRLRTPAWLVAGEPTQVIWGLTARILADLVAIGFGVEHDWYHKIAIT